MSNEIKIDSATAAKAVNDFRVVEAEGGWDIPGTGLFIAKDEQNFVLTASHIVPGGGNSYMGWYPEDVDVVDLAVYPSLRLAIQAAMVEAIKQAFNTKMENEYYDKMADDLQQERDAAVEFHADNEERKIDRDFWAANN